MFETEWCPPFIRLAVDQIDLVMDDKQETQIYHKICRTVIEINASETVRQQTSKNVWHMVTDATDEGAGGNVATREGDTLTFHDPNRITRLPTVYGCMRVQETAS